MSMSGKWVSTTALPQVAEWCMGASSLAILTHAKPDGDAIGSSISVARALNEAAGRKVASCLYSGPMPTWRDSVIREDERHFVGELSAADLSGYDRILITDTGSWSQLEYAKVALAARSGDIAAVDHHAHGDADLTGRRVVNTAWAAVCQASADLCKLILKVDSHMKLPRAVAEPIYLGLATDTGWFRHSNVTPEVMHLACLLLHAGVEPSRLYAMTDQQDREARPRLLGRALNSMEVIDGGRVAIAGLSLKDFAECKGEQADVHGFTDPLLSISSVRVAAVLTEVEGGASPLTKISFRSKSGEKTVDVNQIAQELGGGGHKQAAGAKMKADLATTRAKVRELLIGRA
jgi:phosphoesterase RecJ-like protein